MDLSAYADIAYPLHKASREGKDQELLALLQSGQYEVNFGGYDLIRPLHEACIHGKLECVRILLDHGAQVNVSNIDGSTPLCDACSKGNVDVVKLLLHNGALVNPPLSMVTPLHEAVLYNRWDCAEFLLAARANPNVSDCHHGTPLHIAASRGHHLCAEALLRFGASVNASHILATALHLSCKVKDKAMACLLLEHGAGVHLEDNQGRTARDLVPDLDGHCKELRMFLHMWERSPKSLSHYCRLSVRRAVGSRGLSSLQPVSLNVPQVVKDYLQYRPQRKFLQT